ncbi:MAG: GntG family PLP-dependent aldolase [Gemmatimonadota bacterium]|jgi:threonine aldolase
MSNAVVDLRSDTLSMPTQEMLESVQSAALGDDSRDGDPTVLELEALAAEMMGKEAGLLNPSGTMSNLVAMRTHVEPGATAIVEESAHLYGAEIGGIAAACGLLVLPVPGHRGAMDPDRLRFATRKVRTLFPTAGLVCLENTHNAAGGTVIAPEQMAEAAAIARNSGMAVHLDGARIFNASVALGVDPRTLTRHADTVSFCLSKGLSAPIGSVLTGPKAFIDRARMVRRAYGGTLRQAGIIAAPGLVALRTLIDRLSEDHENARVFAEGVNAMEGLTVDLDSVQSNIVNLDVSDLGIDAATFVSHLDPRGVRGLAGLGSVVRFVTYRGISAADIQRSLEVIGEMVEAAPWS